LEPSRTNLVTQSEYFDSSVWDKTSSSSVVTQSNTISPEGVQNASEVTALGTSVLFTIIRDSIVVPSAGTYTMSCFFKYTNNDWVSLTFGSYDSTGLAWFDIQNGVKGQVNGGTSDIESYGNGWYRCSVTSAIGTGDLYGRFQINVCPNDGEVNYPDIGSRSGKSVSFYGAQFEAGSYPTSYIPNHSGGSVTRGADDCNKTGVSSLIGQTEGTMFLKFKRPANTLQANRVIYGITDDTSANRLRILTTGSDSIRVLFQTNGNQIEYDVNISGLLTPDNTIISFAVAYKSGDIAVYVNGTQGNTSTNSISITTELKNVEIGYTFNSNIVEQAMLFKTRLSNADLETLTS